MCLWCWSLLGKSSDRTALVTDSVKKVVTKCINRLTVSHWLNTPWYFYSSLEIFQLANEPHRAVFTRDLSLKRTGAPNNKQPLIIALMSLLLRHVVCREYGLVLTIIIYSCLVACVPGVNHFLIN